MKWGTRIGKIQITIKGTPKAHWYYYIRREGANYWKAGRYWLGQEIDFHDKVFRTSAQARAYCEKIDRETLVIEGVTA